MSGEESFRTGLIHKYVTKRSHALNYPTPSLLCMFCFGLTRDEKDPKTRRITYGNKVGHGSILGTLLLLGVFIVSIFKYLYTLGMAQY